LPQLVSLHLLVLEPDAQVGDALLKLALDILRHGALRGSSQEVHHTSLDRMCVAALPFAPAHTPRSRRAPMPNSARI